MAETVTNLKVRFGADTKNFKQDLDSGKAAVTNFTGAAGGAFEEFASIFGINMGAVSGSLASVNKSLALLSGGFKGATAGATLFSGALKVLRLALISTGIGAIIVALGSLVAYFTKTERGAEAVERVMASFKAVVNVLIDRFAILGEGIYKLFTGDFKGGWDAMKKSVAGVGAEIVKEAGEARELTIALQKLEDREIALIEVQGRRRESIAQLRLEAKDEEKSTEERLAAMTKAIGIQKQVTADEVSLQKERVRILDAQTKMAEAMDDDFRALAESRAALNDLEAQGSNEIRSMSREYNKLTRELDANTTAIIKNRQAESADLKPVKPIALSVNADTGLFNQTAIEIPAPKIAPLETDKLEASAAKIKSIYGDMKTTVIDFSAVFQDSMAGAASGLGESLGQMLAGSASFSDLGAFVGQTMADMAISVGNIAIGVGVAALGIGTALKTAISTPAGAIAAIAAGTALVALGSWAKSSLSSAASGGGGTYSSSGGGSYDTGTPSAAPQNIRSAPMTIYVNGEFRAAGRDLVAVIDKNAQRKAITT